MVLFIIFIIFALWSIVAFVLNGRESNRNDYTAAGIITGFCAVVAILTLFIITASVNYDIRKAQEGITTKINQKKICIERKTFLLIQYNSMLDSNYKSYEKKLFDQMTQKPRQGKDINVNVNVYPEIKYSQTLIELSKRLGEQTDAIYNYDLDIEKDKLYLRTIRYNPMIIGFMLRKTNL